MALQILDVCCQCGNRDQVMGLRVCRWVEVINPNLHHRMVGRLCGACANAIWAEPVSVIESVAHEDVPPWAD